MDAGRVKPPPPTGRFSRELDGALTMEQFRGIAQDLMHEICEGRSYAERGIVS